MLLRLAISIVVLLLIFLIGLGIYWSREPAAFVVEEKIEHYQSHTRQDSVLPGTASTLTLIHMLETLLDKPGGFISNDIMPPGVWLDNISNWEYGVLTEVRAGTQVLRDFIGRMDDKEDKDLLLAKSRLNVSHQAWAFPGAESEYRDGISHLYQYLERLHRPDRHGAVFIHQQQPLLSWLTVISDSIEQHIRQLNASTAGIDKNEAETTPWLEIDDYFYQARGAAWAWLHIFQAIEVDFAELLKNHAAEQHVSATLQQLQKTQQTMRSPMVLNGSSFGLWANHSLTMAFYLSQAREALDELQATLHKQSAP